MSINNFSCRVKVWILLYATKEFSFFQKLTSTQKSTLFFSERNMKLRWLLCESIPPAVTNSSWFHLWDPDLRQGVKQIEEKQFIIAIISTYKWAGITKEKNVTLLNMTVSQASPFPKSDRANCYLWEASFWPIRESWLLYISVWIQFCYHLPAATKI